MWVNSKYPKTDLFIQICNQTEQKMKGNIEPAENTEGNFFIF